MYSPWRDDTRIVLKISSLKFFSYPCSKVSLIDWRGRGHQRQIYGEVRCGGSCDKWSARVFPRTRSTVKVYLCGPHSRTTVQGLIVRVHNFLKNINVSLGVSMSEISPYAFAQCSVELLDPRCPDISISSDTKSNQHAFEKILKNGTKDFFVPIGLPSDAQRHTRFRSVGNSFKSAGNAVLSTNGFQDGFWCIFRTCRLLRSRSPTSRSCRAAHTALFGEVESVIENPVITSSSKRLRLAALRYWMSCSSFFNRLTAETSRAAVELVVQSSSCWQRRLAYSDCTWVMASSAAERRAEWSGK